MKKIIKTLAVISPAIFLSNQVVSCVDERIDINELIETTELGFIEHLSYDEIKKSIIEHNPKTEGMEDILDFRDNTKSYDAKVGTHPAYSKIYKGYAKIGYNSKLAYKTKDDSFKTECVISKTNTSCELDISILDPTYDEVKDEPIKLREDLNDDFIVTKTLNDNKDAYNIKATLKEGHEINPSYNYNLYVHWHDASLVACNIVFDLD
ncbi:hypothetical protein [Spiroplasma alleghenense]|uniref:Uncharacterized protein n=1 Tax=Spiroplasma alleghenense TaxID=216931 RepID=A0A345Z4X1_9MOLU|nr:hypothetical protein [Spiroplasma alleghenense]AXK51650.1 hypothetical protein SALLE_v1c09800 [Spiroplasma alleghenense]